MDLKEKADAATTLASEAILAEIRRIVGRWNKWSSPTIQQQMKEDLANLVAVSITEFCKQVTATVDSTEVTDGQR